jgi:hypothetical protein
MLIKKSFFVLMFSLFIVSSSYAGIKNVENDLWEDKEDNAFTDKKNNNKIKSDKVNIDKYYVEAKNAYWMNDMVTANMYLDAILSIEENQRALELKNKIILLEEKKAFFKKNIINGYSIELNEALKNANFYEGYLFLNKLTALSPETNVVYANSRLKNEVDTTLQYLETDKDKDLFKKSIDYFSKENFDKARDYIYKLCSKYPKFSDFRGVAESYIIDENNNKAAEKYYKKSLDAVKKGKIYQAKNYIDLAYGMKRNDIKILVLMEQINMEFM